MEMNLGLGMAWGEAIALFRVAEKTGDFASVRADIAPSKDSDRDVAIYRRCVRAFYDHFVRFGRVPRRKPRFRVRQPAPPPQPGPGRSLRERQPERYAAIRDALLRGEGVNEIRDSLHCAAITVRRVRKEMHERELVNA